MYVKFLVPNPPLTENHTTLKHKHIRHSSIFVFIAKILILPLDLYSEYTPNILCILYRDVLSYEYGFIVLQLSVVDYDEYLENRKCLYF